MTAGLTVFEDLVQGSDEWWELRRGIVTASVIKELITAEKLQPADNKSSRALAALLTAERITGYSDPSYSNADMLRGREDEPRAVQRYSEHYAPARTVGFMIRDSWGFKIGYSPDGVVGDDGLLEVKSHRQKLHLQAILKGVVPAEFMAQLQCGLLVSGRAWIDYISYCGGMPMWVKRVEPDQKWFDALVEAVARFEATAAQMIATYTPAVAGLATTERPVELEMVI